MGPRSKGGAPSRSNHLHPILLFHDDRNNLSWCSSIVQHITKKITTKRTQRPKATPAFSFGGRWQHWHLPPLFWNPNQKKNTLVTPHRKTAIFRVTFFNYRFNPYQQTERLKPGPAQGLVPSARHLRKFHPQVFPPLSCDGGPRSMAEAQGFFQR